MRPAQILALAAFTIGTLAPGAVAANKGSVEEQLKDLDVKWLDAEKRGDIDFIYQLFADDYEIVSQGGNTLSKAQMLDNLRSPTRNQLDVLHPDDIEVHVYGKVAVLNDHTTIQGRSSSGQEFKRLLRFTRILVNEQGKWRVVFVQGTPLKQ